MDRRAFCGGVGALASATFGGCLSDAAPWTEPDRGNSSSSPSGAAKPEDARREVEVVAVDDVPEDVPLSAMLAVRQSWITPTRTAGLELSVTNTASTTREVQPLYVQGSSSTDGASGILVIGTTGIQQADDPFAVESDCWADGTPTVPAPSFSSADPPTVELDPGESGSFDLIVDDDPSVEGCFPPGTYRFERRNLDDGTSFRWGFTLEVTDVSNAG